jgi:zinc transporter ZupT
LSILGIDIRNKNWQLRKTILVYIVLSLTAIAVDNIYAIFGHGVSSPAMTWMFLYPLIGGALIYFLIERLIPGVSRSPDYRLFYNVYNSGIATLTMGSFLKGILDIAGTSSPYTVLFNVTGWLFAAAGLILLTLRYIASREK